MTPPIAPLDYVACWQDEDGFNRIGGRYTREAVERDLWPWLKAQGFADDSDNDELVRFLDMFPGDWRANMRPGLRFRQVWTLAEQAELDSALAETIRSDFDAVFAVAHEPALSSGDAWRCHASAHGRARRLICSPRPLRLSLGACRVRFVMDAAIRGAGSPGWLHHICPCSQ
jgi:hypothetical protein